MPQVGAKEFPYTREGIDAAKAESKRSGRPLRARKGMSYRAVAGQQAQRARKRKSTRREP